MEPSKQTIEDYLRAWLKAVHPPALRESTWEAYRTNIEQHVIPALGSTRLQALTRNAIKAFYAELAQSGRRRGNGGLAPKTIHNIHVTLRRALEVAFEDSLIIRNPAARAYRLPAGSTTERTTWTEDELRVFLDSVREDRLFGLWRLAAHTGARRGELLALRLSDLELDRGTISINRNRVKGAGGRVIEGAPKTSRGRRIIDIDPETVRSLREHRKRQIEERWEWGESYEDRGYLFCREGGEPYHPDAISDRFDVLCRAAGVPVIGMHAALRHLHGSILLRQGVALHVVSRRLGHANEAFTARVYAHVLPGQGAEAAATFAAAVDR